MKSLWIVLYWCWVASEIVLAVWRRTARGGGDIQDRGSQLILWAVIIPSLTICEVIRRTLPPDLPGERWLGLLSLVLLIGGLAVRWTAIVSLGKAFSVNVAIRESQQMHRTGLYRFVRHPSYSGMLLIFLAVGLISRNWFGLIAALVPTSAALLYRIHVEERALVRAFGDKYRTYASETERLIPGVF